MAQLIGALREVQRHKLQMEATKAQMEISAMLKGFFKVR